MPSRAESQTSPSIFWRIFRALAVCLAVSASLLCFPYWLPLMVAFWVAAYTLLIIRQRPAYAPLYICTGILLVRLVPHTPWMLFLAFLMALLGAMNHRRSRPRRVSGIQFAVLALLWAAWGAMSWEYSTAASRGTPLPLDPARPIVCVGDSLTEGMIPDRGYPGKLASMVSVPVINKGASGITTGTAIGIVERALEDHPQAVIIELGGHDFLRWHSRSHTKKNLAKLIVLCRRRGAEPILMEIPRGFIFDPYASLERELAYEYDLQLIDDRWLRRVILMGPAAPPGMWFPNEQLSDDGIHSNPAGSEAIARFVAQDLAKVFGPQILLPGIPAASPR